MQLDPKLLSKTIWSYKVSSFIKYYGLSSYSLFFIRLKLIKGFLIKSLFYRSSEIGRVLTFLKCKFNEIFQMVLIEERNVNIRWFLFFPFIFIFFGWRCISYMADITQTLLFLQYDWFWKPENDFLNRFELIFEFLMVALHLLRSPRPEQCRNLLEHPQLSSAFVSRNLSCVLNEKPQINSLFFNTPIIVICGFFDF